MVEIVFAVGYEIQRFVIDETLEQALAKLIPSKQPEDAEEVKHNLTFKLRGGKRVFITPPQHGWSLLEVEEPVQ